jgi:hypothetical protein
MFVFHHREGHSSQKNGLCGFECSGKKRQKSFCNKNKLKLQNLPQLIGEKLTHWQKLGMSKVKTKEKVLCW